MTEKFPIIEKNKQRFHLVISFYALPLTSGFVQGWQDVVLPKQQQISQLQFGAGRNTIELLLLPSTSVFLLGGSSGLDIKMSSPAQSPARYVQCDSDLMIIYKRYIDKRLLSLRLTFFMLATICLFAFKYHYDNLGYFIAVVFITLSIIVVKGFTVWSDSFLISKYYFFGLIKKTWRFNKGENIKLSSFGSDFGQDGDVPDIDNIASGVGCLFSIFGMFVPPKITSKEFKVEKFDEASKLLNSVSVFLDRPEFNYLQTYIRPPQST